VCLKPIQSRQPLQLGRSRLGAGTVPDRLDALSELAISQRASGCAQRCLDRVELMQHVFTGCARFDHADDGVQVSLGRSQPVHDRKLGFG